LRLGPHCNRISGPVGTDWLDGDPSDSDVASRRIVWRIWGRPTAVAIVIHETRPEMEPGAGSVVWVADRVLVFDCERLAVDEVV
jgi:hypothetical protein